MTSGCNHTRDVHLSVAIIMQMKPDPRIHWKVTGWLQNNSLHHFTPTQWNVTGFFTYWDACILVTIWTNQTRITITMTDFVQLSDTYSKLYVLSEHIAMDEVISLIKGWIIFKQHLSMQYKCFGIKSYKLQHDLLYAWYECILGIGQVEFNTDNDSYTCNRILTRR